MKQQSDDNLSRRQQEGLQHMEDRMQTAVISAREIVFVLRSRLSNHCESPHYGSAFVRFSIVQGEDERRHRV